MHGALVDTYNRMPEYWDALTSGSLSPDMCHIVNDIVPFQEEDYDWWAVGTIGFLLERLPAELGYKYPMGFSFRRNRAGNPVNMRAVSADSMPKFANDCRVVSPGSLGCMVFYKIDDAADKFHMCTVLTLPLGGSTFYTSVINTKPYSVKPSWYLKSFDSRKSSPGYLLAAFGAGGMYWGDHQLVEMDVLNRVTMDIVPVLVKVAKKYYKG